MKAEVLMVMRDHHVAVVGWKASESRAHGPLTALLHEGRLTVVVVDERFVLRQGDVAKLDAVGDARPMPTLRAHEHQRLVRGHTKEPRRKARIAAKRTDAAHQLHQRHLDEVQAVVVGDRVAKELLHDVRTKLLHERVERVVLAGGCALKKITVEFKRHGANFRLLVGVRIPCRRPHNVISARWNTAVNVVPVYPCDKLSEKRHVHATALACADGNEAR